MSTPTAPTRRPYRGSCHCGQTRYVVFLTLPHVPQPAEAPIPGPDPKQVFARCNCTICQKIGTFHIRVPFAPDDFLVLSPADPLGGDLGNYQRRPPPTGLRFLFCKDCGTRCFTFLGEGERVEVDLSALGVVVRELDGDGDGGEKKKKTMVWRPKREGWKEGKANGCYLSVNGQSVEAGQEGFDLVQFVERDWVLYWDYLELHGEAKPGRYGVPHEFGAY